MPVCAGVHESVRSLVGRTPVLDVTRLLGEDRPDDLRLFAKLEGHNIAGSVKDRPSLAMIEDAIETGRLRPGMKILEASSGNTAIAVSMFGRLLGYEVTIVAPSSITEERKQLLNFYGATVLWSPGDQSTKASREQARTLAETDRSYCWLDQYANPANPRAHFETTGPELLAQVDGIDALVTGLGSGGTICGTGQFLRKHNPDIKLIGVEPHPGMKVAGLRNLEEDSFIPPNLDLSMLDGKLLVHGRGAFEMVHAAANLGIFIGMSAGAVLSGAVRYARRRRHGTVCAVLADGGWKYLSVGICTPMDQLGDQVDHALEVSW